MAVDLNPVGQIVRMAKSEQVFVNVWQAYNAKGNVVARVPYSGQREGVQHHAPRNHEKILMGYQEVLAGVVRVNRNVAVWQSRLADNRVSAVAKILGAGNLLTDVAAYFECHPHAKVADACAELGVHPRTLGRRFREVNLTPVIFKRACMLTMAAHEVLWSDRPFKDIAASHGYCDAAHMNKAFAAATGGLSPSTLRELSKP